MDALAAEIAKKKAQLGGAGGAKRRWVKTADLDQQRRQAVEDAAAGKRARSDAPPPAAAPRARAGSVGEADTAAAKVAGRLAVLKDLSRDDIFARLRALGEPVTTFGEADGDRTRRLAALEASATGADEDDYRLGGAYAIRNTFLKTNAAGTPRARPEDDDASDDSGDEDESPEKAPAAARGAEAKPPSDFKKIRRWIRRHLKSWEATLVARARADAAKRAPQGRVETKTYKQCKDYIRPLVKLCKKRELNAGLKAALSAGRGSSSPSGPEDVVLDVAVERERDATQIAGVIEHGAGSAEAVQRIDRITGRRFYHLLEQFFDVPLHT
ncbi:hypothetical protein JL721_3912 [Aureococcus anophagefferens]|nr:hypothetical protein JL721_3912 [Aureococcus anophagefferens]